MDIIKSIAWTVREDLGLGVLVDMDDVIGRLGGVCVVDESMDVCEIRKGYGDGFDVGFEFGLNTEDSFTKAVLLGHLIIHMGFLLDEDDWESMDFYVASSRHRFNYMEDNFEAKCFAYELLIPEIEFLDRVYEPIGGSRRTVKELADDFGVSERVVVGRGRLLGIYDIEL